MKNNFGEFVKTHRILNKLTLRKFCQLANYDPSNWSRIERGVMPPPKSKAVLEEIASILNLQKNSEVWYLLMDLAAIDHIPEDLVSNEQILKKLPVFFRTLRGQKPTQEELEQLMSIIIEG